MHGPPQTSIDARIRAQEREARELEQRFEREPAVIRQWMCVDAEGYDEPTYFYDASRARDFQRSHGGQVLTRTVSPWAQWSWRNPTRQED